MKARGGYEQGAWLVPEVIQASAMDCGPASLKSLLDGFGKPIHYGRLREACQTELDGTSIDTLEEVLIDLGFDAEQIVIPLDHLFQPELHAFPALAATLAPDGSAHFVLLWNRSFGRVQVMDPSSGRRWLTPRALERELLAVERPVPAAAFREYAAEAEFQRPLARRLEALVPRLVARTLLERANADPSWRSLGALDSAVRALHGLSKARALRTTRERLQLLEAWLEESRAETGRGPELPPRYSYVRERGRSEPSRLVSELAAPEESILLRGIVLVRVRLERDRSAASPKAALSSESALGNERLSSWLEHGRQGQVWPWVWRQLGKRGRVQLAWLAGLTLLLALGLSLEALLLRGLLDLGQYLPDGAQRFAAGLAVLSYLALITLGEALAQHGGLRLGSRLEVSIQLALLRRLPRLVDVYFQTRPLSDLAERAYMAHLVQRLPALGLTALRLLGGWLWTAAGLVWLDPASAPRVAAAAVLCLAVPLLAERSLAEADRRVRALGGTLSRFYYDALAGASAVLAHSAEPSLASEHEGQLTEWRRAGRDWSCISTGLEALLSVCSVGCSGWLFYGYLARQTPPASALLFLYWVLAFPDYGRQVAQLSRQLPALHNVVLRLGELLDAEEEAEDAVPVAAASLAAAERERQGGATEGSRGLDVEFCDVSVHAGGHLLLSRVSARLTAGEHVAVVGASGAGKSTLLGLLLGWQHASSGDVQVSGRPISESPRQELRSRTVWIDPAVQLWNRSLYDNLVYGLADPAGADLRGAIGGADLESLVGGLSDGLQTRLGEGGGCVSGGEGQRVRLGRGWVRARADLVLLDEPFRGLDRERRQALLARVRRHWRDSTLLCVTHDVSEALTFPRVLVVDQGCLVADGSPAELLQSPASHLASLQARERSLLDRLRTDPGWRRLRLQGAQLVEERSKREDRVVAPTRVALAALRSEASG